MKPERLPFVLNGPDCECGHARVRHVGRMLSLGIEAFDGPCRDCECLPAGYRPAGGVNYGAMRAAEWIVEEEIYNADLRASARRRTVMRWVVGFAFVSAIFSLAVPGNEQLFMALVIGVAVLGGVDLTVSAFRSGDRHATTTAVIVAGFAVLGALSVTVTMPVWWVLGYVWGVGVVAAGLLVWTLRA